MKTTTSPVLISPRQADLFVLPTHSENFGSVVIEALAHGVPVICTKGAPWKELETHRCGWWIDIGVDPLVKVLKEAIALSDFKRHEMGIRGRNLVVEEYSWDNTALTIIDAYKIFADTDAYGDILVCKLPYDKRARMTKEM